MKIDGQVFKSEIVFCERIAEKLGYRKKVVGELSTHIYSDPNITADRDDLKSKAQKFLVWVFKTVASDLAELFCKVFYPFFTNHRLRVSSPSLLEAGQSQGVKRKNNMLWCSKGDKLHKLFILFIVCYKDTIRKLIQTKVSIVNYNIKISRIYYFDS